MNCLILENTKPEQHLVYQVWVHVLNNLGVATSSLTPSNNQNEYILIPAMWQIPEAYAVERFASQASATELAFFDLSMARLQLKAFPHNPFLYLDIFGAYQPESQWPIEPLGAVVQSDLTSILKTLEQTPIQPPQMNNSEIWKKLQIHPMSQRSFNTWKHDLIHAVHNQERFKAQQLVGYIQQHCQNMPCDPMLQKAFDQAWQRLDNHWSLSDASQQFLQQLEALSKCYLPQPVALPPVSVPGTLPNRALPEYTHLIMANDQTDTWDDAWMALGNNMFSKYGYIFNDGIVSNLTEFEYWLDNTKQHVALVDYNFPSTAAGIQAMNLAKTKGLMVLAISASEIMDPLPDDVINCGNGRWTDPEYLHATIVSAAYTRTSTTAPIQTHASVCSPLANVVFPTLSKDSINLRTLEDAIYRIQQWAFHYLAFIESLSAFRTYVGQISRQDTQKLELAQKGLTFIAPFQSKQNYQALLQLAQEIEPYIKLCREQADSRQQGSVYLALHSTLEQHLRLAKQWPQEAWKMIRSVSKQDLMILSMSDLWTLIQKLHTLQSVQDLTLSQVKELKQMTEHLNALLPVQAEEESSPTQARYLDEIQILQIEDDPIWAAKIEKVIEVWQQKHKSKIKVNKLSTLTNYQDAKKAIQALKKTEQMTIAILDLAIPESPAKDGHVGLQSVTREHGRQLIELLRTYRLNIPCIVLTAPTDFLQDQVQVTELGISDSDYLFKTEDAHEHLIASLDHLLLQSHSHQIELWLHQQRISIDQVPIPLPSHLFQIFYALAELSTEKQDYFSPERILNRQQDLFGKLGNDQYNDALEHSLNALVTQLHLNTIPTPLSEQTTHSLKNILRIWAAQKEKYKGNLKTALYAFKNNLWGLFKEALHYLDLFRLDLGNESNSKYHKTKSLELPEEGLIEYIELLFGGLQLPKEANLLLNLEKEICDIRKIIHETFQLHQQAYIDVRNNVLQSQKQNKGYLLSGQCRFHRSKLEKKLTEPSLRVLVVEDDPILLAEMTRILQKDYQVASASSVQEAIETGIEFQPDLLSLDLAIPYDREQMGNPNACQPENGILVLSTLKDKLKKHIRAIVNSSLIDDSLLREQLIKLGVRNSDMVSKNLDSHWKGYYAYTVQRMKKELLTQMYQLNRTPAYCPAIEILPQSNFETGKLNLMFNHQQVKTTQSNQGRLLAYFLKHPYQILTEPEIRTYLGLSASDSENTIMQLIKQIRKKIRTWLHLSPDVKERPELIILEKTKHGYVLNAFVSNTHV